MQKLFTNFHPNLNNKSILVTGGTGSFGKKFVEKIVKWLSKILILLFMQLH